MRGDRPTENCPSVCTARAADLQFLLAGDHTSLSLDEKSILLITKERAIDYLKTEWSPVVVGRRRNGNPRLRWQHLPSGARFSEAQLATLWCDVRVNLVEEVSGDWLTLHAWFKSDDVSRTACRGARQ